MASTLEELVIPVREHDDFVKSFGACFPEGCFVDAAGTLGYTDGSTLKIITRDRSGKLKANVKGKRVYLVVSPRSGDSVEKRDLLYHWLKSLGCAVKEAGAAELVAVMSDHFYDRCHRDKPGESKFARQVAWELKIAGFDKVLAYAVHSKDLEKYYEEAYGKKGNEVLFNLDPSMLNAYLLVKTLDRANQKPLAKFKRGNKKIILARIDDGAGQWVSPVGNWLIYLGVDPNKIVTAEFIKNRLVANTPGQSTTRLVSQIPSFRGAIYALLDDKFDTGGSVHGNLNYMAELDRGMPSYVVGMFAHGLFNDRAPDIVRALSMNIVASTSNPTRMTKEEIKSLPVLWYDPARYFYAAVERCIRTGIPVEQVFTPENIPRQWVDRVIGGMFEVKQDLNRLIRYKPDFSSQRFLSGKRR